jgi:hypothetical protein
MHHLFQGGVMHKKDGIKLGPIEIIKTKRATHINIWIWKLLIFVDLWKPPCRQLVIGWDID